MEMILTLAILWKKNRGKNDIVNKKIDPADITSSNYITNQILRKIEKTEFDLKAFENELAGGDKMTPEFKEGLGGNTDCPRDKMG